MAKNTKPSIDPADEGSLEGVLRTWFKKAMQGVDGMMPAKIGTYDRDKNRGSIQPLVKVQGTDGQIVSRAPLASIPTFKYGGGGMQISFPMNGGETGWIMAGDRDTSLVQQSADYGEQPPNTDRMHSFENGMFFPDATNEPVPAEHKGDAFFGKDGTYVAVGDDVITIKNAKKIKLMVGDMLLVVTPEKIGLGDDPDQPKKPLFKVATEGGMSQKVFAVIE